MHDASHYGDHVDPPQGKPETRPPLSAQPIEVMTAATSNSTSKGLITGIFIKLASVDLFFGNR
jgi:hypothetical protein